MGQTHPDSERLCGSVNGHQTHPRPRGISEDQVPSRVGGHRPPVDTSPTAWHIVDRPREEANRRHSRIAVAFGSRHHQARFEVRTPRRRDHLGRKSHSIAVAIEQHAFPLAVRIGVRLDPLTDPGVVPEAPQKAQRTFRVRTVMLSHDRLDGLGRFIGVVEGNGGDVVVEDVSLNDAVEEMTANESKLAIDGGGRTPSEIPAVGLVVRQARIRVLQVRDGH